jgi:hypothetical protein
MWRKKAVVAQLRYYTNICQEELRKITKTSVRAVAAPTTQPRFEPDIY